MNRRSFLTNAARLAATGAVLAVAANAPRLAQPEPEPAQSHTKPGKKQEPNRKSSKRLAMCPSHR